MVKSLSFLYRASWRNACVISLMLGLWCSLNFRRIAKISGKRLGPISSISLREGALVSWEEASKTILHLVFPCFSFFTAWCGNKTLYLSSLRQEQLPLVPSWCSLTIGRGTRASKIHCFRVFSPSFVVVFLRSACYSVWVYPASLEEKLTCVDLPRGKTLGTPPCISPQVLQNITKKISVHQLIHT